MAKSGAELSTSSSAKAEHAVFQYQLAMWSTTCRIYSDYFATLAKAASPAEVVKANADMAAKAIEFYTNSIAARTAQ